MRTGTRQWQVMHFTFNKLTLQCVRTYKQGVSSLEINGLQGEEQRPPPSPPLAALFHVPSDESLDTANPCLISRNCGIWGGGKTRHTPQVFFFQFGTDKKLNSNVTLIRSCCLHSRDLWLEVWWCYPMRPRRVRVWMPVYTGPVGLCLFPPSTHSDHRSPSHGALKLKVHSVV